MDTLATLFLYSARQYSNLADAIFGDSVEQSQFAASTSSRRMEVSKAIIGTSLDIQIDLHEDDMEVLSGDPDWQSCIAFDNILLRTMAQYEVQFLPLLMGIYVAAHQGAAYVASQGNDRPKHKLCLACGAVTEQWECPVCSNEKNWLVSVEFPENTEEIEPENTMPNFTFGDFPPEMPAVPKKWEVFFDGDQGDDIFKATGLPRPTLG